jgi:hypothetical protein
VVRDDPPPQRPRRPRPQINIDIPGLFGRGTRDRPTRTPNNPNTRIPGTTQPNPTRPPRITAPPSTPNATTVPRRRPRPTANDPRPPGIR